MRTITYTYDENKATNKDYLIAVLTDSIDDGGASYESVAKYDIDCPIMAKLTVSTNTKAMRMTVRNTVNVVSDAN